MLAEDTCHSDSDLPTTFAPFIDVFSEPSLRSGWELDLWRGWS